MTEEYNPENFERLNHLIGRLILPIGFLLTFLPLTILWIQFGVGPELKALSRGLFENENTIAHE